MSFKSDSVLYRKPVKAKESNPPEFDGPSVIILTQEINALVIWYESGLTGMVAVKVFSYGRDVAIEEAVALGKCPEAEILRAAGWTEKQIADVYHKEGADHDT